MQPSTGMLAHIDLVVHLLRIKSPEEHQMMQEVAEGLPLVAIDNPGMGNALLVQPEKILVMRHGERDRRSSIGEMCFIIRALSNPPPGSSSRQRYGGAVHPQLRDEYARRGEI